MASILIVDDEPSARLTLGLLLRHRGHLVREAESVTAAKGALAGEAYDIGITDLRMPDGLGLDVLRASKARCPDADVILLTAHPGWESAAEAMRLGAFDYFEKGQEPGGLFQRIDRALAEQVRRRRIVVPPPSAGGERRFLTVLFADMRGSMELLAATDLDEARAVLDTVIEHLMECVHRTGGTVNQVMGDGIMALFGAPISYPDHAARACRAAVQMQSAVARYSAALRRRRGLEVQIRIGINSGDAIVRSVGSDLRWDYSAVGTSTHVAARMEQLASPGTTVLTADTLALARGVVDVRPLGPVAVKGLSAELEVFELVGLRSRSGSPDDEAADPVARSPREPWATPLHL